MELLDYEEELRALGIRVAAMTYDEREQSRKFSRREQVQFPILQDLDAAHAKRFGVLNEQYPPGHRAYGIPYPGILLIDGDGVLRFKFAEKEYQDRPPWPEVMAAARMLSEAQH